MLAAGGLLIPETPCRQHADRTNSSDALTPSGVSSRSLSHPAILPAFHPSSLRLRVHQAPPLPKHPPPKVHKPPPLPPPPKPPSSHLQRRVAQHLLELDVTHWVTLQQLTYHLVQHLSLLACVCVGGGAGGAVREGGGEGRGRGGCQEVVHWFEGWYVVYQTQGNSTCKCTTPRGPPCPPCVLAPPACCLTAPCSSTIAAPPRPPTLPPPPVSQAHLRVASLQPHHTSQ
jgi:hypothetical protein